MKILRLLPNPLRNPLKPVILEDFVQLCLTWFETLKRREIKLPKFPSNYHLLGSNLLAGTIPLHGVAIEDITGSACVFQLPEAAISDSHAAGVFAELVLALDGGVAESRLTPEALAVLGVGEAVGVTLQLIVSSQSAVRPRKTLILLGFWIVPNVETRGAGNAGTLPVVIDPLVLTVGDGSWGGAVITIGVEVQDVTSLALEALVVRLDLVAGVDEALVLGRVDSAAAAVWPASDWAALVAGVALAVIVVEAVFDCSGDGGGGEEGKEEDGFHFCR